jgi:hypothetical protein
MELPGLMFLALTLCLPIWFVGRNEYVNLPLMFGACLLHIVTVFLQNSMLQNVNADAHLYYYGLENYLAQPLTIGTSLVVHATFGLRTMFDLSFIDMMLLFGLIGTCPILMLIAQVGTRIPAGHRLWAYAACLLPGMFFWTSVIGKDAITTAGIALAMVCARDLPKRSIGFACGILIVMLIRPHVALLLAAAFGVSRLFFGTKLSSRFGLILLGFAALPIAIIAMQNFIGINVLNFSEVSQFFNEQQGYVATTADEGVVYIANPLQRAAYFLFRPMFFDADTPLALIASFENLAVLLVVARIAYLWRQYGIPDRQNAVFYALAALALMLFLGLTGYNVGLALRQKVMAYPALVSLLILGEAAAATRKRDRLQRPVALSPNIGSI